MKSAAISRFVVAAAIAALVMVGSTGAWAQCPASPNYITDFSTNVTCLSNVNAAPFTNGNTVLRLTTAAGDQYGSSWYITPQPLQNGFSTSFQFEFTNASTPPADGIAFVIQNSSLTAIGSPPSGGALAYGDHDGNADPSQGEGIPKSLAIEFDNYQNPWDPQTFVSHVAIQSCGQGPNTSHHNQSCSTAVGAPSSTLGPPVSANLSGNTVHSVTIVYALACPGCSPATTSNNIHVILDNVDLYPSGVNVDLASLGLGTGNTAYVGFTGATGGDFENQDILNWTFTPQAQSGALVAGAQQPTVLNYSGGPTNGNNGNTGYEYDLQLDATGNGNSNPAFATGSVTPIVMDQKSCNKLVQKKFPLTQCFVFQNADGQGNSGAVLFELTCPDFNGGTSSQCGDPNLTQFAAALGTSFTFLKSQNPGFQLLNATIGPYPGWLKGSGPDDSHPCTPFPNNSSALFQSNQVSSFSVSGDPLGTTKGKSGGSGSCWVATYATTGELPPGIQISAPAFKTYTQNTNPTMQGVAVYTCSNPSTSFKDPTGATGPYLTVASCTQNQSPNKNNTSSCSPVNGNPITCTGTFDISTKGLHTFTVTSKDSGGNLNANIVIYNVK
ncbi:MAG: L-type lectin-domain containing protein [Terriglobales bacterium]